MDSNVSRASGSRFRRDNEDVPVYARWDEVPKTLKTRRQWKEDRRLVLPKQKPSAYVAWKRPGVTWHVEIGTDGSETSRAEHGLIEKPVKLFDESQTRPYKGSRAGHAAEIFFKTFVRNGSREKFLCDDDGWKTYTGRITEDQVKDHWTWAGAYGVFGGEWTRFAAIDLDLHNGDQAVFLDQLRVLLDEFHGDNRCHYQVADRNANGIHLIQVFHHRLRVDSLRSDLRDRLRKLDQQHPELAERARLAAMKSLGDLEIFPSTTHGFRLPLCRGRTMLVNQPLAPIYDRRRKRQVADVLEYASWLTRPSGYMPADDVIEYVRSRLRPNESRCTDIAVTSASKAERSNADASKTPQQTSSKQDPGFLGQLRGQFATKLVAFWSAEVNEPDSLNKAIVLLARLLPHCDLEEDDAVELIERYIDELPHTTFSDRLSGGRRSEVSRVVQDTVAKVYLDNGGQQDSAASDEKLAATVEAWRRRGFDPTDKATWDRAGGTATPVLAPDFEWSDEHLTKLDDLALLLTTDIATASSATNYILRLVSGHPGELALGYIKSILEGFGIRCGHHGKVNKFLEKLLTWKWIYVRVEDRWHGRGSGRKGRARAFGIGEAMKDVLPQNMTATVSKAAINAPEVPWVSQDDLLKIVGWNDGSEGEEVPSSKGERESASIDYIPST